MSRNIENISQGHNKNIDPTSSQMFNFLFDQSNEKPELDFKLIISTSKNSPDIPKIMKDVFAFCNYGGGYIILGIKDNKNSDKGTKGKYIKVGLPDNFQIDSADLQEKINSYLDEPIQITYKTFTRTINKLKKEFAMIYFPASLKVLVSKKDISYKIDGKTKVTVKKNIVYVRRGTQSIPASELEKNMINKRIKDSKYSLAVVVGEPDKINEIICSNLFKIKKIPDKVYFGTTKCKSHGEIIEILKQMQLKLNFRMLGNEIITFENIINQSNKYRLIIQEDTGKCESISEWLKDEDKSRIVISLLNKEIMMSVIQCGLSYESHKAYYKIPQNQDELKIEWQTRYKGNLKKQMVKKKWGDKLDHYIYLHKAIKFPVTKIKSNLYLRLNPTMLITKDGDRDIITGIKENAIITGETYRVYNKQQLNNILFWIHKLVKTNFYLKNKNIEISDKPIEVQMPVGIKSDMPPKDFERIANEYDTEMNEITINSDDGQEIEKHDF